MNAFETIATVDEQGQVRLVGLPFAPGAEVEVTIKPTNKGGLASTAEASVRAAELFAALDKARNTEPIGRLRREELYDRKVLR